MERSELEQEFKNLMTSLYQGIGKRLSDGDLSKEDAQELIYMVDAIIERHEYDNDSWSSSSISC